MNIKKFINISRELDDFFTVRSLSNIVLDYIIEDSECVNCFKKYEHILDYPYFKIISVEVSSYPKYIQGESMNNKNGYFTPILKEEFNKLDKSGFIEFTQPYDDKTSFYDTLNNLIYKRYDDKDRWVIYKNISEKQETKDLYSRCILEEEKRLEPLKKEVGKIIDRNLLGKYIDFETDHGDYLSHTINHLLDNMNVSYNGEQDDRIFTFIGEINIGSYYSTKFKNFSRIIIEGIY